MATSAQYVHVCNNTTQLYEFAPAPGEGRLDFPPGWSRVPAGAVDRITGGFDRKGKTKGGIASRYFDEPIEVQPGKFRPVLHLGRPAPGETVHKIDVLPGVRSHYRMSRARVQEKTIEELRGEIQQLRGMMSGGKAQPSASTPDIAGLEVAEIKTAIKGLDAAALKQLLADEVIGENRSPVVKLLKKQIAKG